MDGLRGVQQRGVEVIGREVGKQTGKMDRNGTGVTQARSGKRDEQVDGRKKVRN